LVFTAAVYLMAFSPRSPSGVPRAWRAGLGVGGLAHWPGTSIKVAPKWQVGSQYGLMHECWISHSRGDLCTTQWYFVLISLRPLVLTRQLPALERPAKPLGPVVAFLEDYVERLKRRRV